MCLVFTVKAKADSWIDPSWKNMLDSSDLVALVQYTSTSDHRASAKIVRVYKGSLNEGDEIYISGFSNRYGPIDKMYKGDTYLVFSNLYEPSEDRIEYWNQELKANSELKDFVDAFKNKEVFSIWTPTSGDLKVEGQKVQYNLIQSSFYPRQEYYSLPDFEDFLFTYYKNSKKDDFCNKLLSKIKPATESKENSQYLMKLFLLGFDKYDTIYEHYIKVENHSSKYALAQLMGNIKTVASRTILIALLDDKNSIVQGEVVRQLKNEPAESVAPILLQHLKSSSGANFGPTNIMNPVLNTIDGGKFEIIKTLGEFKYQPAVPDLLLLLETDNDDLFLVVINALRNIGTREYTAAINKHLDNKTIELIFNISRVIADDSLYECLPSFKNFISTCNRNIHPNYEYTISTCCGIGHFNDSATIAFLLSDCKNFLTYKDTLESSKRKNWTQEYIQTFGKLKVKEARPLIYQSVYDWFGLSEDFGRYPKLFGMKRQLEDSIRTIFAKKLGKKGYKINYCIAFIENTADVENGKTPIANYLIEVTVPANENGDEHMKIVSKALNLNTKSIFLRFENGWYHLEKEDRFDQSFYSTPLPNLLKYSTAVPNKLDLLFLQAILDNNFITDNYARGLVGKAITDIKANLSK